MEKWKYRTFDASIAWFLATEVKDDFFFQSVTKAYNEKENPNAPNTPRSRNFKVKRYITKTINNKVPFRWSNAQGQFDKHNNYTTGNGIAQVISFRIRLKCYYEQIIDIHFFTLSCTIWLPHISCQISIHY